jgi:hypothetical protein
MPQLDEMARVADRLDGLEGETALAEVQRIDAFLQEAILPHEEADDREIYPILADIIGGDDPMAAMSLTHSEIFHLAGVFHRMAQDLHQDGPAALDVFDLRRTMYGLHAILRLHFAQEEALYQSLDDEYPAHRPVGSGAAGSPAH